MMNRALSRRLPAAVVLLALSGTAPATVTYDGTEGVFANIFNSNSRQACVACHSSALVGAVARSSAPDGVNFNTYAQATSSDNEVRAVQRGVTTAYGGAGYEGYMPPPGDLTAGEMNLLLGWEAGGHVQNAVPSVTFGSVTSTAYSFTINATVNDNGGTSDSYVPQRAAASTFAGATSGTTYYSISSSSSLSTVSTNRDTWTGGGLTTKNFSHTFSSLSCGTRYFYRISASNSVGTNNATDGAAASSYIDTTACISVSPGSISSKPEATTYTTGSPLATISATGGDGGPYTYSISAGALPAGIDITPSGANAGKLTGTTPNLLTNTVYNFTVEASDGVSTGTQAYALTITADNDAPSISSTASTSATEGAAYNYDADGTVSASDPEGTTLTYSLNAAATTAGMTVSNSPGTRGLIAWTPANGTTSLSVVLTVSDGVNDVTQSWTITVAATNDAPSITSFSPPTTATEDTLYSYTVTVTDIDDANNGVDLVWSLPSGAPSGMSISNTAPNVGRITWTPSEGQVGSFGPITVRVQDGGENGSVPSEQTFSVTASAVNDAPTLGVIGDQDVTELDTFTFDAATVLTDPDDANNGVALAWSLTAGPGSISNVNGSAGTISYTPGEDTVPAVDAYTDVTVTVRVADGGENGAAAATRSFTLRINKLDADGDLVADYNDNCVNDANADQADNDGDGVAGDDSAPDSNGGNACDVDDDNDGMSDVAELANTGLDPFDDSDRDTDLDGDGISNFDEFAACDLMDTECLAIGSDSVGPQIFTNGDQTVVATGYLTAVAVTATATDIAFGLPIPVDVSVDNDGPFRPGVHVLNWSAYDDNGNLTEQTQTVTVIPTVSVTGSTTSGESRVVPVCVLLDGESPSYPVDVDFTVGGTATAADHDLVAGTLTINSGTEACLSVSIAGDAVTEADETLVVTLTGVASDADSAALSDSVTATISIVDRALPPVGNLWVEQNSQQRRVLFTNDGTVSVMALTSDPNGDTVTATWSTDPAISGTPSGDTLTLDFDPSGLAAGSYDIVAQLSDGALSIERRATLVVIEGDATVLDGSDSDGDGVSDEDEGLVDNDADGLLDHLDAVDGDDRIALRLAGADAQAVAVTEPGLHITAGTIALGQQGGGIQISSTDVVNDDDDMVVDADYVLVGALYDFEITGLTATDPTARVVLPLPISLPPDAVWRKFINGGWFTFVESDTDLVESGLAVDGNCPGVAADAGWVPGLVAGNNCVRLTLSDGGPNDADGEINGAIRDPGGAAVARDVAEPGAPRAEEGGGNTGLWFLMVLVLAGFRTARHRK